LPPWQNNSFLVAIYFKKCKKKKKNFNRYKKDLSQLTNNLRYFYPQKIVTTLSESMGWIRDPEKTYSGPLPVPDSGANKAPDPGLSSATLEASFLPPEATMTC
jgi:hypothetical protein